MSAPRVARIAILGTAAIALAAGSLVALARTVAVDYRPPAFRVPPGLAATHPPANPASAAKPRARSKPPRVRAAAFLVVDFGSGAVLASKRAGARYPIASLTKIMTTMLVLHSTSDSDVVTASKRAARQIPTKLGLHAGDRMDVHDLLYALMLHSSNDVAVALAEHVSGSVRAFDQAMTAQAVELGLEDTSFASPSGLSDKGYSTARDLAAITEWAYHSKRFAALVATRRYTLEMPSGARIRLKNLNALLFDYPGALGVKTGYTSKAHWSLVAVASRGSTRVLVVLLADPKVPFEDGVKLLDWAFARQASLMGRVR